MVKRAYAYSSYSSSDNIRIQIHTNYQNLDLDRTHCTLSMSSFFVRFLFRDVRIFCCLGKFFTVIGKPSICIGVCMVSFLSVLRFALAALRITLASAFFFTTAGLVRKSAYCCHGGNGRFREKTFVFTKFSIPFYGYTKNYIRALKLHWN